MRKYYTLLRGLIVISIFGLALIMSCTVQTDKNSQGVVKTETDSLHIEANSLGYIPGKSKPDTSNSIDSMHDRLNVLMQDLEQKETTLNERESELVQLEAALNRQRWISMAILIVGLFLLGYGYLYLFKKNRSYTQNELTENGSKRTK